jgi:hypothetical protein
MGITKVLAVPILAAALAISPAQGRGDGAAGTLAPWVGQWLTLSAEFSGFCDRSGFLERARNKGKGYLHLEGLMEPPSHLPWLEGRIWFPSHGSWSSLSVTLMPVFGTNLDFMAVFESEVSSGGLYLNGYVRMTMRRDERGNVILGAFQTLGTSYSIFSAQAPCAGAFSGKGKVLPESKVPVEIR